MLWDFLPAQAGEEVGRFQLPLDATCGDLKERIEEELGPAPVMQQLLLAERILQNEEVLLPVGTASPSSPVDGSKTVTHMAAATTTMKTQTAAAPSPNPMIKDQRKSFLETLIFSEEGMQLVPGEDVQCVGLDVDSGLLLCVRLEMEAASKGTGGFPERYTAGRSLSEEENLELSAVPADKGKGSCKGSPSHSKGKCKESSVLVLPPSSAAEPFIVPLSVGHPLKYAVELQAAPWLVAFEVAAGCMNSRSLSVPGSSCETFCLDRHTLRAISVQLKGGHRWVVFQKLRGFQSAADARQQGLFARYQQGSHAIHVYQKEKTGPWTEATLGDLETPGLAGLVCGSKWAFIECEGVGYLWEQDEGTPEFPISFHCLGVHEGKAYRTLLRSDWTCEVLLRRLQVSSVLRAPRSQIRAQAPQLWPKITERRIFAADDAPVACCMTSSHWLAPDHYNEADRDDWDGKCSWLPDAHLWSKVPKAQRPQELRACHGALRTFEEFMRDFKYDDHYSCRSEIERAIEELIERSEAAESSGPQMAPARRASLPEEITHECHPHRLKSFSVDRWMGYMCALCGNHGFFDHLEESTMGRPNGPIGDWGYGHNEFKVHPYCVLAEEKETRQQLVDRWTAQGREAYESDAWPTLTYPSGRMSSLSVLEAAEEQALRLLSDAQADEASEHSSTLVSPMDTDEASSVQQLRAQRMRSKTPEVDHTESFTWTPAEEAKLKECFEEMRRRGGMDVTKEVRKALLLGVQSTTK
eukprot:g2251.t1